MDRGYVVEEAVTYGELVEPNMQKQTIMIPSNQNESFIKFEVPDELLFTSKIFERKENMWVVCESGTLTTKHFIQNNIENISKLKVKKECDLKGSHILKITLNEK